jgi:hypothetical protein
MPLRPPVPFSVTNSVAWNVVIAGFAECSRNTSFTPSRPTYIRFAGRGFAPIYVQRFEHSLNGR